MNEQINLSKINTQVDTIKNLIGNTEDEVLQGKSIIEVIAGIKAAQNGGITMSKDDYDALEDKTGVYYVYDGNDETPDSVKDNITDMKTQIDKAVYISQENIDVTEIPEAVIPVDADTLNGHPASYFAKQDMIESLEARILALEEALKNQ